MLSYVGQGHVAELRYRAGVLLIAGCRHQQGVLKATICISSDALVDDPALGLDRRFQGRVTRDVLVSYWGLCNTETGDSLHVAMVRIIAIFIAGRRVLKPSILALLYPSQ